MVYSTTSSLKGERVLLNYPMRALSKCGRYLIDFRLEDGPCPVDKEHFVLTERPGSPILLYSEVGRGSDIPNLFEGDIIQDEDGKEYIITYFRGLVCQSIETSKYLEIPEKFKISGNIYKRRGRLNKSVSHKFICKDIIFTLQEIYGVHENNLIVNVESNVFIPEEVKQYSGLRSQSRKMLFFGDDGLTLHKGRICVLKEGKYLSVVDKEVTIE